MQSNRVETSRKRDQDPVMVRRSLRWVRKRLSRKLSVIDCHCRRNDWEHVGVHSGSCANVVGLYSSGGGSLEVGSII